MTTYRTLTTIGGLVAAATLALAQITPPVPPAPPVAPMPPAPPAVMVTPVAPMAPMPPMPPMPPMAPDVMDSIEAAERALEQVQPTVDVDVQLQDLRVQLDNIDLQTNIQLDIQDKIQDKLQYKIQDKIQEQVEKANEKAAEAYAKDAEKYATVFPKGLAFQQRGPTPPMGPRGSEDGMYQSGLRDIDNHQYEQALSEFNNVVSRAGTRTEGALYWKAYVLNKLGRSAEAQAAIDTLRKSYPSSRWLEDSKALELEVKQSKGPVSPDAETDDDIKVLALNGLMQSDPEKALPQVENLLKGAHSPNLKRQALFVIAQNNSPKAQEMLVQIARGGNPDLQVRAIQFMSEKRNPETPKILLEIYSSTGDPAVKRAILDSFSNSRDKGRLMEALRGEKDANLRSQAINRLGDVDGQPELWQIYGSETTSEGKIAVLNAMSRGGNLDKLTDVAKNDKDPKVRQKAIEMIASQEGQGATDTLVALYSSEQDEKVKQNIIDHLAGSRARNANCQPLVNVAKAEKDMKMKLRIIQRLSNMTTSCQAATDYLTELLAK